jgi:hypothetical protein
VPDLSAGRDEGAAAACPYYPVSDGKEHGPTTGLF